MYSNGFGTESLNECGSKFSVYRMYSNLYAYSMYSMNSSMGPGSRRRIVQRLRGHTNNDALAMVVEPAREPRRERAVDARIPIGRVACSVINFSLSHVAGG